METRRWRKAAFDKYPAAEKFLLKNERFCVSASARFLQLVQSEATEGRRDHVWYLADPAGGITSLLIHSRYSLYPVFGNAINCDNTGIPCPAFLKRFLIKVPIHSVQGLWKDVKCLETLMEDQGYFAYEQIDYELMSLDSLPKVPAAKAGLESLLLRPPALCDKEQLFAINAAYEQEEVLPKNATFNPAASRINLERILKSERILVAEFDGRIVGKLNTNAESFTRYQIGGVYVSPEYRSLGIASRMIAIFSSDLLAQGKGITLFSKTHNKAARKAYLKAGFQVLSDYRISYF